MVVEIKLTKGHLAIVDDIDADLAKFKWQSYRRPKAIGECYYAHRSVTVSFELPYPKG